MLSLWGRRALRVPQLRARCDQLRLGEQRVLSDRRPCSSSTSAQERARRGRARASSYIAAVGSAALAMSCCLSFSALVFGSDQSGARSVPCSRTRSSGGKYIPSHIWDKQVREGRRVGMSSGEWMECCMLYAEDESVVQGGKTAVQAAVASPVDMSTRGTAIGLTSDTHGAKRQQM